MTDIKLERRGFTRKDLSFAAVVKVKDDVATGRIENISLSGLYVRLENDIFITPGEPVTVAIHLDGPDQSHSILCLHARVVRMDEKGMGLRFRPMTTTNYERLMEIIALMEEVSLIGRACL